MRLCEWTGVMKPVIACALPKEQLKRLLCIRLICTGVAQRFPRMVSQSEVEKAHLIGQTDYEMWIKHIWDEVLANPAKYRGWECKRKDIHRLLPKEVRKVSVLGFEEESPFSDQPKWPKMDKIPRRGRELIDKWNESNADGSSRDSSPIKLISDIGTSDDENPIGINVHLPKVPNQRKKRIYLDDDVPSDFEERVLGILQKAHGKMGG